MSEMYSEEEEQLALLLLDYFQSGEAEKDMEATKGEYQPGQPVTWIKESRGGYGWIFHIPAIVIKVGKQRIGLAVVPPQASKTGYWEARWVKPESIRPREEQTK